MVKPKEFSEAESRAQTKTQSLPPGVLPSISEKGDKSRVWDHKAEEGVVDLEGKKKRSQPGVDRKTQQAYLGKAIYIGHNPDKISTSELPPPEVQEWISDILGEQADQVKVRLHPLLKRWTIYAKFRDPNRGEDIWEAQFICCEAPIQNEDMTYQVPEDFVGKPLLESFSMFVGEFRQLNRQDIEDTWAVSKRRPVEEREEFFDKVPRERIEAEEKKLMELHDDLADLYWYSEVNRANGGMRLQSFPTVELKMSPEKYDIIQRNGYKIKLKKGDQLAAGLRQWPLEKTKDNPPMDLDDRIREGKRTVERDQKRVLELTEEIKKIGGPTLDELAELEREKAKEVEQKEGFKIIDRRRMKQGVAK